MSDTELSVVCKNCSSEVSPYVTECPYCGARLRKRAPKLERRGDALEASEPRRKRGRGERRRPKLGRSRLETFNAGRPYATIALIVVSAAMVVVYAASGLSLDELGAIVGSVGGDFWRYLTASFAYADTGYLFVIGVILAIFGPGVERRLGLMPTLLLLLGCGTLGMLAADGIVSALGDQPLAAGGNAIALGCLEAWFVMRRTEVRESDGEGFDLIGVAVAAGVIIALPLFEDTANVYAGLAGGLVGALAGLAASRLRPGD